MVRRKDRNRDSSQHWKWGIFYHDPNDPKIWVEKLYGMGWTLNMARPAAWVILVAFLSAALVLFLLTT
ncbi:MAG: hypothetical protein F4Z45_04290 [Gammaproteobacteria bacterium]|nr:hypothetical protein [Gammaproteobacteria bacterium]